MPHYAANNVSRRDSLSARLTRLLQVLAVVLTPIYAPAALALFGIVWLTTDRTVPRVLRVWIWPVTILLSLFAISVIQGHPNSGLLLTSISITAATVVIQTSRRSMRWGFTIASLILLAVLSIEHLAMSHTWYQSAVSTPTINRISDWARGTQLLVGEGTSRSFYTLSWKPNQASDAWTMRLETRLVSGSPGTHWFSSHPDYEFATLYDANDGVAFTRIGRPSAHSTYLSQRINTGAPIAGRTFRFTFMIRSAESITTKPCDGLVIRELLGEGVAECFSVTTVDDWLRQDFDWTAPQGASSHLLNFDLRVPIESYDIATTELYELTEVGWEKLEPLEPNHLLINLAIPGASQIEWPSARLQLSNDWSIDTLTFQHSALAELSEIRTVLWVESGLDIEVRSVELRAASEDTAATRIPTPDRQRAVFPEPNLAGHTGALAGLLPGGAGVGGLTTTAISYSAAVFAVLLTGSRTAGLALLIGLFTLLSVYGMIKGRWKSTLTISLGVLSLLLLLLSGGHLGRLQAISFDDGNSISRIEIWNYTWQTITESNWTAAHRPFRDLWVSDHPNDSRMPPNHAHNFALQLGFEHGLPGLVLAVLFLSSIVWLGIRQHGLTSLAVTIPFLLMNFFDYTLFYQGIIYSLILYMNASSASTHTADSQQTPTAIKQNE